MLGLIQLLCCSPHYVKYAFNLLYKYILQILLVGTCKVLAGKEFSSILTFDHYEVTHSSVYFMDDNSISCNFYPIHAQRE